MRAQTFRSSPLGAVLVAMLAVLVLDKAWTVADYAFGDAPRLSVTPKGCADMRCVVVGEVRVHPVTRALVLRADDGREWTFAPADVAAISPAGVTPLGVAGGP